MRRLDSDGSLLQNISGSHRAVRDIVQFMPFRKYNEIGAVALAQEALVELPAQIMEYFALHNITPRIPSGLLRGGPLKLVH